MTDFDPSACAKLKDTEARDKVVIFRRDRLFAVNDGPGAKLNVGEPADGVAVSPDGQRVAWKPKVTFQRIGKGATNFLSVSTGETVQTSVFPGHYPLSFAVSGAGELLAITATTGAPLRLLLFDSGSPAPKSDLTDLVSEFAVAVGISQLGTSAVIASRERAVVIDPVRHGVVYRTSCKRARLSPEGNRLAYIDNQLGFVIRDLNRGTVRRLMPWTRVHGLGGWSPDGKFLLIGAFPWNAISERILAVDVSDGASCLVSDAGQDDVAGRFVWIKKALLSP